MVDGYIVYHYCLRFDKGGLYVILSTPITV